MAGLLTSTFRIPGFHQLADLFPKHIASLRERLHRGDQQIKTTIIKLKFEPEDHQRIDLLQWLNGQENFPRVAWTNRENSYQMAGIGSAAPQIQMDTCQAGDFSGLARDLAKDGFEYLRFFGGIAFDPTTTSDAEWRSFNIGRFVAPMFSFEVEQGQTRFIAQIVAIDKLAPALDRLLAEFLMLNESFVHDSISEANFRITQEIPNHSGWLDIHHQILTEIDQNQIEKVVLAKKLVVRSDGNLSPLRIFQELDRTNPHAFKYYFEFEEGSAFTGASPERLFSIHEHELTSEALAGTRPQGTSATESRQFGDALLTSEKDQREHGIVFDELRRRFELLTDQIHGDDHPGILNQVFVQHLHQSLSGRLKTGTGPVRVLEILHPTPALGGHPQAAALGAIKKYEPFCRGWFGGPVGWIQGNQAEFAVGIRSALCIAQNQINLYAGVGIVAGSEANAEWAEMNQKLRVWEGSLGL